MEFSASNIRNRSFSKGLRGLDSEEVYSFLDDLADQWAEMASRIETLEAKLDEIGDAASKAKTAKNRAEELQEDMRAKEQRLDERERDLDERHDQLEAKQAKLRSIAERLQGTLREEKQALSSLTDGATATDADVNGNGESTSEEKSTEEWVDSLFPDRLPGNQPTETAERKDAEAADESDEDLSASESQFEAIKEDVQGIKSDGSTNAQPSNNDEDDTESPPTEEMNQIWDVFDEQEQA